MAESNSDDQRLRRRERLTLDREFQAAFRGRRSTAGRRIVLYARANQLGYNRLGLVVGRKLGRAFQRNRFKRLVREAFRRSKPDQPVGWDWLVLPRLPKKGDAQLPGASPQTWTMSEIQDELLELMHRAAGRGRSHGRGKSADG
jgi:ribonuclease P protein component